ncbi:glucose-6-phosphate dehydrogenase [Microbacterium sp. oral taxon 186 str. F0373]|uniref:glucose-6-phosphate dehydrogenase n=1 Tax=Microbacterium sp. oral taxon 186 TaxID=712383 RepID=UPI00034EAFDB|nr:glucose-6-phosphate dehydrogenase [Microbacterium sp. oral taxon 186]EPD86906.1 glucose-6-phosphate dehydrogenase [Microbacterium sp. oral taxon 186 str. F0373]
MGDVSTLVIIGGSGDLTQRLLLPALADLLRQQPARQLHLVGVGRTEISEAQWRRRVRTAFREAGAEDAFSAVASTPFITADATTAAGLRAVIGAVPEGRLVLYFAVPPAAAAAACAALSASDLPEGTVLALEKPFGEDEASARELNAVLLKLLPEQQVFRVDHFLGRSTVLDVLGARFANRLLEPIWSAEHIERVEIRFDETLGLEGRAGFYDHAGALVDMIQSHLLQVMAVVAMEPPAALTATDLRDATAAVLRATHVWDDNAVRFSHRARYTAGTAGEERMPSYVDEPGVDPARETETLAQVRVEVRNARWAGVPFTLRSGKALAAKRAEVDVVLRPVRHLPVGFTGDASGAVIRFGLGPDKLTMQISVNGGEEPFALHRATLEADLGLGTHAAYTEVLAAILDGDAMLAVRGDAAEECWRIVQPVRDAWRRGDVPMEDYPAGSDGPDGWAAC